LTLSAARPAETESDMLVKRNCGLPDRSDKGEQ
jgi:hypothetical protein